MKSNPQLRKKLPLSVEAYEARPLAWRLWRRYRLVWRRRFRLFKAFRARHDLTSLSDNTDAILDSSILCFVVQRNEADKLPYFLDHHRALGVDHFLIVDNNSDDGSTEYLKSHSDVSVWHTKASYREARFGVSWVGWLLRKYGVGHWCLTLDCDELMVIPNEDTATLNALTAELDRRQQRSFRTVMIEMYPKGQIDQIAYVAGDDPILSLPYFDADNFVRYQHPELSSLVEKGGVRARYFFPDSVQTHAPHMQKTPLVRWQKHYAYLDSTHTLLPRDLNRNYGPDCISGALLHMKFLPTVLRKSADPAHREEHFTHPDQYAAYYDKILQAPDFWHEGAVAYKDWRQLIDLGLMSDSDWA